ncbi:MAG: class I SAM-dependent RNA methyltransferase [Betaproteobacteria bacterium]|nr:class I SAM-dependent RNA methyltransferase [Betaproteobacteria bacterium]
MARDEQWFAPCPRGLETVLGAELAPLGARDVKPVPGGVGFAGDWTVCMRANLWSRIATRVLWRVGQGRYRGEEDIYRIARDLPWSRWFEVRRTLRVFVTAQRSPLRSLEFITLRIKDAVCDQFRDTLGRRPDVDTAAPDVRVHAFLSADSVTLYLDTSGEPLYKRGLGRVGGEAPIKENLAAGILALTGWQPGEPLLDPMCGAGTFLMEAGWMALDRAPGLVREFGFQRLSNFDAAGWAALRAEAQGRARAPGRLAIWGSDADATLVEQARRNLRAAGLEDAIAVEQADVLERTAPGLPQGGDGPLVARQGAEAHAPTGVLVANPPYGVRLLASIPLEDFYPRLGDALKRRFAGWRCYILSADPDLPRLIRLKARRRTPLFNGALECRLLEYRMVSGSARPGAKAPERRTS